MGVTGFEVMYTTTDMFFYIHVIVCVIIGIYIEEKFHFCLTINIPNVLIFLI